jgi:hypothetical protein
MHFKIPGILLQSEFIFISNIHENPGMGDPSVATVRMNLPDTGSHKELNITWVIHAWQPLD